MIYVIFALGSLWMTLTILREEEFDSALSMVSTYLITWGIMFALSFFIFAFVIGI